MEPTDLRQVVDATLTSRSLRPLSIAEWKVLDERGFAHSFARGEAGSTDVALDFLLHVLRPVQEADRARTARTRSRTSANPLREAHDRALAVAVAADAVREDRFGPDLREFRGDHLNDTLLPRATVDEWIRTHATRDGPPEEIVITRGRAVTTDLVLLEFGVDAPRHIPVSGGGVLGPLLQLSTRLADFYGWRPADATTFVLTGMPPPLPSLRTRVHHREQLPGTSRITMDIHPTCTPQEVAAAYAQVRLGAFGRLRRLTPKHARLAAFYAEQPEARSVDQRLRAWNRWCERHGQGQGADDWRYRGDSARLFGRDARRAFLRLTALGGAT